MTLQQPDLSPAQEPGIGGPVDLAGIEAYRKFRTLAVLLLGAAMAVFLVANVFVGLDWPEHFPFDGAPSVSILILHGTFWACIPLSADVGNRAENRLAWLGALWAVVAGTLAALGAAVLLALVAPTLHMGIRMVASLMADYAVVLPFAIPFRVFTHRRLQRLVIRAGPTSGRVQL